MTGLVTIAGRLWRFKDGGPWASPEAGAEAGAGAGATPAWRALRGERRQEVVLIGPALDVEAVSRELDACLLSEDELQLLATGGEAAKAAAPPVPPSEWWGAAFEGEADQAFPPFEGEGSAEADEAACDDPNCTSAACAVDDPILGWRVHCDSHDP